ncbi:MAG: ATP-binding protein [Bacteroidota bacterium]
MQEKFLQIENMEIKFPNRIISFLEDDQGHYWIGSWSNGLYEYKPDDKKVNHHFDNDRISSLFQTLDGTIWASTPSVLWYKKKGEKQFSALSLGTGYREVTDMVEMPSDSSLWLVGWNIGLIRLDMNDWEIETYEMSSMSRFGMNTYSLLLDEQKHLWIGSWGKGLFRFDIKNKSFQKIAIQPASSPGTFDYDIILDLFQDAQNDLWIGADGGGIVRLSSHRKFKTITSATGNTRLSLHYNTVMAGTNGEIWAAARANGLIVIQPDYSIEKIRMDTTSTISQEGGLFVQTLYQDNENQLWAGLIDSLVVIRQNNMGKRVMIPVSRIYKNSFKDVRKVTKMLEFDGLFWIATQQDGLFAFEEENGKYKQRKRFHTNDQYNTFEDNRISTLVTDKESNLWIGTYKGIYRMSPQDTCPVNLNDLLTKKDALLCDIVLDCYVDKSGNIWLGTPCSLTSLSKTSGGKYQLKQYTIKDGFTDDYVNAVMEGDGYIWISTNAGISRLNPESGEIQNYDVSDGVGGYNFTEGACTKSNNGTIYFGGYSDLTFFKPETFKESSDKPKVVITNFMVMNQNVPVSKDGILPVSINELPRIILNHKQKEFSFEIAALDFKSPRNNQYAYRLNGMFDDGEWVYTGRRRHFSFSNLKPGDYTLQLAGSNSNGVWNMDGPEISIEILPPPWKTWYAFMVYLMVLLGIVTLIIRVSLKQERLQNLAQIEHIKRLQEHEMNEYKLRFFTDISHELKTPITLIDGPIKELKNRSLNEMGERFFHNRINLMYKSTVKLTSLLNQLLEFRKVEAGKAALVASKLDIVRYVSSICESYKGLAKNKKISFITDFRIKKAVVWFEPSKMDIIVNNLLLNAFNHSGKQGNVSLALSESENEIILTVSNTGKSIPKEDLNHLFDRFYQSLGRAAHIQYGFGIGLNLVKRFVDLHGGQISVDSEPGGLTSFTVKFQKGDQHLKPEQKSAHQIQPEFYKQETEVPEYIPAVSFRLPRGVKGARILVVEDNEELSEYLVNLLEDDFEIVVAADGRSGFESAIENCPDLVLSDVMMPKTDGYELCEKLKNNPQTAHIPVILLTAKDKKDDQLMGTRKGADAYITKPFDPVFLLEKIKQVILARLVMAEKYTKRLRLEPLNKEISSEEEKMIRKVIAVIEKNMEDPSLDSDFVAAEMGMSISTFYRKMKKTVGQPPGEFIKSTRLKMAARYLKETNLTVSEIVERVGYIDIRNFRKSFKHEFGTSPAEYRKSSN